jgi:hypothetical protein
MKKQIFIDGVNEYNVLIEGKVISLFYSSNKIWSDPDGFIISLTDTGNGFKVKSPQKSKNYLEYDDALELGVLLRIKYLLDGYKIEMVDSIIEL